MYTGYSHGPGGPGGADRGVDAAAGHDGHLRDTDADAARSGTGPGRYLLFYLPYPLLSTHHRQLSVLSRSRPNSVSAKRNDETYIHYIIDSS